MEYQWPSSAVYQSIMDCGTTRSGAYSSIKVSSGCTMPLLSSSLR